MTRRVGDSLSRTDPRQVSHVFLATALSLVVGFAASGSGQLSFAISLVLFTIAFGWLCVRFSVAPFAAFCVFAVLASPRFNWPVNPFAVFMFLAVAVFVATWMHAGKGLIRCVPATWLLVLIPVVAAVGSIGTVGQLPNTEQVWIATASLIVVACWLARYEPSEFVGLMHLLLWTSVILSGLAVYQRAIGTSVLFESLFEPGTARFFTDEGRSAATFGHPLIYGIFAQSMAILSLLLRPKGWQLFFLANAAGVLLSGSRTAWLGLAAGVVLVAIYRTRSREHGGWQVLKLGATALAAGVVLVVLAPGAVENVRSGIGDRVAGEESLNSVSERTLRNRMGWDLVVRSNGRGAPPDELVVLFGNGAGFSETTWSFASGSASSSGVAATFDNSYLTVLVDSGAIGLLLLVGLSLVAFARSNWMGRILLITILIDLWTFDFARWPIVFVLITIAMGIGQLAPTVDRRTGQTGFGTG